MATRQKTSGGAPTAAEAGDRGGARPAPVAPSFGMCEGVRAELEQVDKTTDPFTGKAVTRDDLK